MARFVLVEIPDNTDADDFVSAVKNGAVWFGKPEGDEIKVTDVAYKGWTVPGVFAVPTKLCECPDYNGKGVRSTNYGWFVHAECAKPRGTSTQYPFNLLEKYRDIKERVYTLGFRADRKSAWGK